MKLIAFDLEACNRYVPGSLFSVGIVEADDTFRIYEKTNILINPETRFVTKFRKPIEFNIDEKELRTEPNFPEVYAELKCIFEEDAIFVGHSIGNDLRMLNSACRRYHKPSFNFDFICSQRLYSVFANTTDGIGLHDAAEIINLCFNHHRADEDAEMSLKLIEFICKTKGVTLEELLGEYRVTLGSLRNFEIRPMTSEVYDAQQHARHEESKRLKKLAKAEAAAAGEAPKGII